jgi:flavin reductase (DIM6/NTAB) family NADH-FMN oxidoreductase RutF/pimeloyl-ACP methyl ester carboxylesterase
MRRAIWEDQVASLSKAYDVIAVDLLGHGGSSLPPSDARLSDYADQVLGALDDLGLQKAHVIGHSMGALVALELALAYPTRVASVTAMNAVFCRSAAQRKAVEQRLSALETASAGPLSWDETIARWFGDPVPAEWSRAAAKTRALLEDVDAVGYERSYRLFATADEAHRDRLRELAVPALFLTGADDPNSTAAMSDAMARLAGNGRCEIVSGERHMMSLTAPAEINRRLLAFLDQVDGEGRGMASPAPDVEFDRMAFRKALGVFLTGVTVVASSQEDGQPRGFTANSFTSVSLDPPLVSVCIAKTASSYPIFAAARHFSVNILAETQADVSSLFATRSADKFAKTVWRSGPAGSPILADVAAWFDCRRHDVVEAGDHIILIGEVVGFDHSPANPLGYCRGAHVAFGLNLDRVAANGGRLRVGAILERENAILLVAAGDDRFDLPAGATLGADIDPSSLAAQMTRLGVKAELGFLFAVFEDKQTPGGAMSIYYRGVLSAPPAPSSAARLVPFDEIPWAKLRDDAIRSMLRRYVRERTEDAFGVYVGDAETGTVQTLARSA